MYKILITTKYYGHGSGVSIHTAVAEFADVSMAVKACGIINNNPDRLASVEQKAIALF